MAELMVRYWLRWLAVLPSGLLAGLLATFTLHLVLYQTLTRFVQPYPELPERVLTPLVIGVAFIWGGSRIAPQYRFETGVGLFGLWMALLGGFVFLKLSGNTWMGRPLYFHGGWLAPIAALVGGLVGLYVVRMESTRRGAPR